MKNRRNKKKLKADSRKIYNAVRLRRDWFSAAAICREIGLSDKNRDWISKRFNNLVEWGRFEKSNGGNGRLWKWVHGKKKDITQKKFVLLMTLHKPPVGKSRSKKEVKKKGGLSNALYINQFEADAMRWRVLKKLIRELQEE